MTASSSTEDRRFGENVAAERRIAAQDEADFLAQTLRRGLTVRLDLASPRQTASSSERARLLVWT